MNEIPKVVFSKTLAEAKWAESSIAHGDLADEIATLRRQSGGEIIALGPLAGSDESERHGRRTNYPAPSGAQSHSHTGSLFELGQSLFEEAPLGVGVDEFARARS
jgi:hypothetical protein